MELDVLLNDIGNLLVDLKVSFLAFLPKFLIALLIFLAGYLLAHLVEYLSKKIIKRTNRLITNQKVKKHLQQKHLEQSSLFIGKTLYWIILIIFITIASEVMGIPVITAWLSGIVQYLPNVFAAIVIIFVGIIGGRIIADLILTATMRSGIAYGAVLSKLVQYSILMITIIIAIDQVGIDIALVTIIISIVLGALLFSAALSFGLGAKTSVSNIIASYYIHNSYSPGNLVRVNDIEGIITQITSTSVIIDTQEGQVSIPAKVFNESTTVLLKKGQ